MNDETIEQEIQAKGLTAPRVTPADVEENIASEYYFTGAAVSLAYNIGVGAFCQSTVVRRFNAGDKAGACDAFLMWNRAGWKVVQGLVNRRQKEREMCLKDY